MDDPILASLLSAVKSSTALQLPVTILSRGIVVEGDLVAESRWLDELAELLRGGSEAAVALAGVFRDAGVSVGMAAAIGDDTGQLAHLVRATVRSGGEVVSTGLWRLQVEAVDGWRLGRTVATLRAAEAG